MIVWHNYWQAYAVTVVALEAVIELHMLINIKSF